MNIDKLRQQYTAYLRTDGYIPVPKGEKVGSTAVGGQFNLTVESNESMSGIKAAIAKKKEELTPKPTTNPRKIAKKIKKQEKKAAKSATKVPLKNLKI